MNDLFRYINQMDADRRHLFMKLLKKEGVDFPISNKLIKIKRRKDNKYPLSYAQQRIWFMANLYPGIPIYNEIVTLHIEGLIQLDLIETSLNKVIHEHEILRTSFFSEDGVPYQMIKPYLRVSVPFIDLVPLMRTSKERKEEVKKIIAQIGKEVINVEGNSLLKAKLIQVDKNEYYFVLVMHHIICDATSNSLLIDKIFSAYEALKNKNTLPTNENQLQYVDYTIWQRENVNSSINSNQLNYWKNNLNNIADVMLLPISKKRDVNTYHGTRFCFTLNKNQIIEIKKLCTKHNVTMFMFLLSIFKILIFRYTNSSDIVVGTTIANRNHSELEQIIGLFANILVLRTSISNHNTFKDCMSAVKDVTLNAYNNQDVPFEKLVEELSPNREYNHNPLFQVMFNMVKKNKERKYSNIRVNPSLMHAEISKFDLSLNLIEKSEEIDGVFEYNTSIFTKESIDRLADHFFILTEQILKNEKQLISSIPITSKKEENIIKSWNNTKVEFKEELLCLHQIIEKQVELTPDSIAISFDKSILTYQELNKYADQTANYLRSKGITLNSLVGVFLERSPFSIICILGILKAGAAYVPLDLNHPKERLKFIISDSQLSCVITSRKNKFTLYDKSVDFFCYEDIKDHFKTSSFTPLKNNNIENLAYVIYTSGSTGRPKGVMIQHKAIVNRLKWMQKEYKVSNNDVFLNKTPFSFDVSLWEIFLPLITGSKLILAKPKGHMDSSYLANLIHGENITFCHFVPSMLYDFLENKDVSKCTSLNHVICSGEKLPYELKENFFSLLTAELSNLYGPTEAAVDVTFWKCKKGDGIDNVPIGKPISNIQLYILDEYMSTVPIGVPGEIYIGGVGLAKGYINPQMNKEKFIRLKGDNKSILYKTGDKGKYMPDGNVQFLGRLDEQIKLRGNRIELGEIESVLLRHPNIKNAFVVTKKVESNIKLIAYYVPINKEVIITDMQLKNFLRKKLPEIMVPNIFTLIEKIPLISSGKVDKKLLSSMDVVIKTNNNCIMPRNKIEKFLAEIWNELLNVKKIGVYDNFFDLGGHSLLASRVVARIKSRLRIDIPLRKIFEYPTLSDLAEFIAISRLQESKENIKEVLDN